MIRSMTGYGSAELERDGQRLTAEIRSVNHRYCEVSVRAPKLVNLFEDQIRQLLQERFSRGKFNLSITWSGAGDSGEVLKVNEAVVDRYVKLLEQLRSRYRLDSGLDIRTLATLPDVFAWEHTRTLRRGDLGAAQEPGRAGVRQHERDEGAERARRWRTISRSRLKLVREAARQVVRARAAAPAARRRSGWRPGCRALLGDIEMDPIRHRPGSGADGRPARLHRGVRAARGAHRPVPLADRGQPSWRAASSTSCSRR